MNIWIWTVALAATPPQAPEAPSEVFRTLAQRHDPGCEAVEAVAQDPVADLLAMTRKEAPAWVPMRAAACLATRHTDAVRPQLEGWVVDPQTRGFMLAIVGLLDRMPAQHAQELATLAMTRGSDPEAARVRVRRSADPVIRDLAEVRP